VTYYWEQPSPLVRFSHPWPSYLLHMFGSSTFDRVRIPAQHAERYLGPMPRRNCFTILAVLQLYPYIIQHQTLWPLKKKLLKNTKLILDSFCSDDVFAILQYYGWMEYAVPRFSKKPHKAFEFDSLKTYLLNVLRFIRVAIETICPWCWVFFPSREMMLYHLLHKCYGICEGGETKDFVWYNMPDPFCWRHAGSCDCNLKTPGTSMTICNCLNMNNWDDTPRNLGRLRDGCFCDQRKGVKNNFCPICYVLCRMEFDDYKNHVSKCVGSQNLYCHFVGYFAETHPTRYVLSRQVGTYIIKK